MNAGHREPGATTPPRRLGLILTLSCFSLVAYVLRMNISVAAVFLVAELHLTKVQLGQLFGSFLAGYTAFQLPWGIFGDRFGARAVLCIAAISWGVTSFLTGLLPGLILKVGLGSFLALIALRFLLGVGEAAGFPVAARAIESSMPKSRHGWGYSAVVAGLAAGSALTPPLVSRLMVSFGWRESFYITSSLAFILAAVWSIVSRDQSPVTAMRQKINTPSWRRLLRIPAIWNLSLSYFFESYALYVFVFWSYLYLLERRHFTVLQGGFFTGLPFLAAMLVVPAVGYASDLATDRFGYSMGRRNLAIALMTLSATFLFCAVRLDDPYLAIGAISLSVASLLSVEAIFWSSAIKVGGHDAGAAGAIMNTAGNLGGILSTFSIPILLGAFGWSVAFGSSSVLLLLSALLWLRIKPSASDDYPNRSGIEIAASGVTRDQ
jgi:MFS transporter, ACS family, glucarate transporter